MSIKRNFFFNSVLTGSKYVFPLITYPYVSRVLGVTNIGICNFVDSIINYFIIISMMGMNVVGIRTIAKNKTNSKLLSESFVSLFLLNFTTTILAIAILSISVFTLPQLASYKHLLFLGILKIFFNVFLFEWVFQGLEDFKYITVRGVLIKLIYVLAIFAFVNSPDDYIVYYSISVALIIINALVDFFYARKLISISFNNINLRIYIKPFINMGIYYLISSLYISLNVAYLGFISGNREVGYFTTAVKLYSIIMAIFTAFTTVMSPRISSLVAQDKMYEIKDLINKSFDLLIMVSFPLIIFCVAMAPEIIYIISGPGYEGAIWPMRIIMPLLLIIGLEQILIVQLLIPFNKDKSLLNNAIIGAIVGVVLNIMLVGRYNGIGSSIAWVVAEVSVLISASYFVNKAVDVNIPFKKIFINLFFALPYVMIVFLFKNTQLPSIILILLLILSFLIYFVFLNVVFLKNELLRKSLSLGRI